MKDYFKQVNVNPKNKKSTDCVIRTLVTATTYTIEEIINSLTKIYLKNGWFITDKKCVDRFLDHENFIKQKQVKKPDNTKYTVAEFCEYLDKVFGKNKGAVIVSVAGHIAPIVNYGDGNGYVLIDSWNCGYKCVGTWWVKSKEE
jgi:hypothetical protein